MSLRNHLSAIWARKLLIGFSALVAAIAATAFSVTQPREYEAEAQVLVDPSIDPGAAPLPSAALTPIMQTAARLATSFSVAEAAAEEVGGMETHDLLDAVTVQPVTDTQILSITATADDADRAAAVANEIATAFLRGRRQAAIERLDTVSSAIRDEIGKLDQTIERLERRIDRGPGGDEVEDLAARVAAAEEQRTLLREHLAAAMPLGALHPGELIKPAEAPPAPVSPKPVRNVILALIAGSLLGMGIPLVAEQMADRVRGPGDLESLAGAPTLGAIPVVQAAQRGRTPAVAEAGSDAIAFEAYRMLRTAFVSLTARAGVKSVLVTSARQQEGKSTTAANLAAVLAQNGKRVVLVSADLRKPTLHALFGAANDEGLTSVLWGELPVAETLVQVGSTSNLRLLPAGPPDPDPAGVLGSRSMSVVLSYLREGSDYVIVDAPPVLVSSDAAALAPLVDGVLLVADAARTTRESLAEARHLLERSSGQILGCVLNRHVASRSFGRYPEGSHRRDGTNSFTEPADRFLVS